MKIAHLSGDKRSNGNRGGVEKFAEYFQRAMQLYGHECDILVPGEKRISDYDVLVADGAFAQHGYPSKQLVISVVHGTWAEWRQRTGKLNDFIGDMQAQHNTWNRPDIKVVVASDVDRYYVKKHHGRVVDAVIYHGVDTEVFKPLPSKWFISYLFPNVPKQYFVMHSATNYCKTAFDKLDKIGDRLVELGYKFEFLNCWDGNEYKRFQEADIFLHPSLHEGCAYSVLEAMSCNVPIVASKTGLTESTDFSNYGIGILLDYRATPEEYVDAVDLIRNGLAFNDTFKPREWVLKNASFEVFAEKWMNFINSVV